ncbi:hypothetical protein E2542_SST08919 [Spatholobus suberectus]|nr:hypothetical protein E2542_SST08919 [Spatholobus suberectus]
MPDFSVAPFFGDHTPFVAALTVGEARPKYRNRLLSYTSVSSPPPTICAAKTKGRPSSRRSLILALVNGSSLRTRRQLRPLTANEIRIVLPCSCSRAHVSLASLKIGPRLHCRCCKCQYEAAFHLLRSDKDRPKKGIWFKEAS